MGLEKRHPYDQHSPYEMTHALQRSSKQGSDLSCSTSSDDILYNSSKLALLKHKQHSTKCDLTTNSNVDATIRCLETSQNVLDFLRRMWVDQKNCDMVFACQNGEMLAHRVVFAAHSSILAEKFSLFGPDQIVTIQLSDFAVKPVFELTQLLYTTDLCLSGENVAEIYKCTAELGLNTVFEYAREYLSKYNNSNAILFYNICDKGGIADLRDEIFAFICDNFQDITQHEAFKGWSLEDLTSLLRNNHLGVSCELEVFFAVCSWLEDDRRRMPMSHRLLGCVRFQFIEPKDIRIKVGSMDWLFKSNKNNELINQAYEFHNQKATGSHLVARFPVQVPRSRSPTVRRKKSTAKTLPQISYPCELIGNLRNFQL